MEHQTFQNPFLNIPQKKLDDAIDDVKSNFSENGILTHDGAKLAEVFHRYYMSNIPVDYWYRDMHDFIGPNILKRYYQTTVEDLSKSFKSGRSARLAGNHGVGKTLTLCSILKRVVETNKYNALYVNLTDIIHVMLNNDSETKNGARSMLLSVDFLVIDELDTRFMGSDNAADLFGRILEPIMRTRIQNRMPLFFCTNSIKVEDSFSGPLQASIESLFNLVKLVPIIGGKDVRDLIKKGEI